MGASLSWYEEKCVNCLHLKVCESFDDMKSMIECDQYEIRQRGKWIWKSYDMKHNCGDIVCSKCSYVTHEGVPAERLKGALWDYCPACGSDNRKEQTNEV